MKLTVMATLDYQSCPGIAVQLKGRGMFMISRMLATFTTGYRCQACYGMLMHDLDSKDKLRYRLA